MGQCTQAPFWKLDEPDITVKDDEKPKACGVRKVVLEDNKLLLPIR